MTTPSRTATILFASVFFVLSIWQLVAGKLAFDGPGLGTLTAAGITLALFSFLYEDNPLFKIAEHLYVGVALGYSFTLIWYTTLLADLVQPLFMNARTERALLLVVPSILGIMMVVRIVPKVSWLSRISFAWVVGFGAGISVTANVSAQLLEQIYPTLAPGAGWEPLDVVFLVSGAVLILLGFFLLHGDGEPTVMHSWVGPALLTLIFAFSFFYDSGMAALILMGVCAVLVYFFFSVEHSGVVGAVARVGIWFLMVAFGASFGFTIMARISLLIGRMRFLLGDWLHLL